ncbi:hypothetical protein FB451DRAFT_1347307 [Mycena latifolia]|nr:hypothetical protein FB451DRAFT_1347307 [Mycena latifolia]
MDDAFRLHAQDAKIGAKTLAPPFQRCPRPKCNNTPLGEASIVESRLYTLHRGVLPVFSKSTYCCSCYTRYYPNYSVFEAQNTASRREYYSSDIPSFIHVTESSFMEPQLCTYFATQMALSHASAEGISRVYNLALGGSEIPNASRLSNQLDGELVLESFFLHAVLKDKSEQNLKLSVPHHGFQNHRLDQALQERNYRMVGTGQEMWAHACDRCMKVYQGADGQWYQMTAGVHDGVTVRHLCCSVHDCTEPLPTQKARYCSPHQHLNFICYIEGCSVPVEPGFSTCSVQSHRAHQLASEEKHAAMFQLKARLQNINLPQEASTEASSATNTTASPGVKGKNSRSWTHNEQLFVRCCGVLISRATMFGSEGITGAFLKATFPPNFPGAMPSYIFYDNNCQFRKHLTAQGDTYFDRVGLPVDVWHFKCKHKEGDLFCQVHCNPARFQELIGEDNKWVFNSSAAEQTNAWFGKFQNVVQEMNVLRYNFFLDEMIAIHNRQVVSQLQKENQHPYMQVEADLRGEFHIPSA